MSQISCLSAAVEW